MEGNTFYIAYSLAEEEGSANQIQTKNTFLGLEHVLPNIIGIFLGNRRSLFWKIRSDNNKYFVDKTNFKTGIFEKYFKIGILRKNLFPYLFACRCARVLRKYPGPKNIYIRQGDVDEFLFYLKRLDKLNIRNIVFEFHNLNFSVPDFYYWNFEKAYSYKKHLEFFNLLKINPQRTKLVTLTKSLAHIITTGFAYKESIEIIPDAHNFTNDKTKGIRFGKEKVEIIYTGLNFRNRGVEIIIDAINLLPNKFFLRLVGGQAQQREDFRKKYGDLINQGRLIIDGAIPHSKVRDMIVGADIAVIPTPSSSFADFTSPLKLFEYMAIGMPIVASDSKSFKEILSKENALFFRENDSGDLAGKIKYLLENQELAQRIGTNAFLESKKYTYARRAEKIRNLFKNG